MARGRRNEGAAPMSDRMVWVIAAVITVVAAYPEIEDQLAVITDGRDQMPPFDDALTDAEIRAIAEHTRRL